jgi:IMP dehydrogenase
MAEIRLGLTYDDVLLMPRRSGIRSRREVETRSPFTPRIVLETPLVSANMDTVTTAPMAIAMAQLGGIGVIHRFLSIEEEVTEVRRVKRYLSNVVIEPYYVEPGVTVSAARAEARRLGVTGFLVREGGGRLLGILTSRDLLAGDADDPVAAVMTPADRLVTAEPGVALEHARQLLRQHRIEKLPLVGTDGAVHGLITLRDLGFLDRYPYATRDERGRLRVAAAIGVRGDFLERAEALISADVDALVLDIAHGHADSAIEAIQELKAAWPATEVVAGNVATGGAVEDLVAAGADAVKVGIGPGFACTTRLVAGVGVPQLTAVLDCARAARGSSVPLVADGGIRRPGDVAKAMAAGASTVMVGSLFAGREESPGDVVRRRGQLFKVYRGMASRSAAAARLALEGQGDALDQYVAEGEEMEFPLRGPVSDVVEELAGGLRSGMSYVNAGSIEDFWEKASFIRQTEAGERESKPGTPT